MLLSGTEYF